jgi:hypothetical protein
VILSLFYAKYNGLQKEVKHFVSKEKIQAVEIMKKLRYYSSWLNKKGGKE